MGRKFSNSDKETFEVVSFRFLNHNPNHSKKRAYHYSITIENIKK
jgi:hypothetical protein